jgi:hypothetical protein
MKLVVRLAIVVAALLLVTNMAFAKCDQELCYNITYTEEDTGYVYEDTLSICLSSNGFGFLYSYLDQWGCDMYLFGGGPGWFNTSGSPAFGGNPSWSQWLAVCSDAPGGVYSLQPIGEGYYLTGVEEYDQTRYTVKGQKVSLSNCPD